MNGDRLCLHGRGAAVQAAAAVFFVMLDTGTTLAGASWWPHDPGPLAWALLAAQALACLSLVALRRAPLAVVAVLGGFSLAVTLLVSPAGMLTPAHDGLVWAPFATALAAYGPVLERHGDRARRWRTVAVLLALTVVVARPWEPSLSVITVGLLRTAVGPLLALYVGARRQLVQALTERAERAERERHLLAEQARAAERARIAAEMHDILTHRVSLMVLQAGALRVTATDDATRQAAEDLRAGGCQALEELRDLVGILRTSAETLDDAAVLDTPGRPAMPGARDQRCPPRRPARAETTAEPDHVIAWEGASGGRAPTGDASDLAALVAERNAIGMATDLLEEGDRALASPVVRRTVHRVVREALTNVGKHAPGARATVRVAYAPTGVCVTVHNTAPTGEPDTALAATGSGLGIVGLRRRLDLVHGTLRAGGTADGGFRLEATLPSYVPTARLAAPETAGAG